jgi:hypothetical protein
VTPAERARVCVELDRVDTPLDAVARRLLDADLEQNRRGRLSVYELEELEAAEDQLNELLERGRLKLVRQD